MKSLVFRVDSSYEIGTGHVYRCITLAQKLKTFYEIFFISRLHDGNIISLIKKKGFTVFTLPKSILDESEFNKNVDCKTHSIFLRERWDKDAYACCQILNKIKKLSWIIVDHYAIDHKWENNVKQFCKNIMVIDDLNDRKHACKILVDPNYNKKINNYYGVTPLDCKIFAGSKFSFIKNNFIKLRASSLKRRENLKIKNILIFMGGADVHNASSKVLQGLARNESIKKCNITVIIGLSSKNSEKIRELSKSLNLNIKVQRPLENLAKIFYNSDLAIIAAGSTFWESCYMGLPSILVSTAINQEFLYDYISDLEIPFLKHNDVDFEKKLNLNLDVLINDQDKYRYLSKKLSKVVSADGLDIVINELIGKE